MLPAPVRASFRPIGLLAMLPTFAVGRAQMTVAAARALEHAPVAVTQRALVQAPAIGAAIG